MSNNISHARKLYLTLTLADAAICEAIDRLTAAQPYTNLAPNVHFDLPSGDIESLQAIHKRLRTARHALSLEVDHV